MAADMAAQPRVDALLNQSPPYLDVDLYASDQPLRNAVASNGGDGDAAALSAFGKQWGSAEPFVRFFLPDPFEFRSTRLPAIGEQP